MYATARDYAGMKLFVFPDAENASRAVAEFLVKAIEKAAHFAAARCWAWPRARRRNESTPCSSNVIERACSPLVM